MNETALAKTESQGIVITKEDIKKYICPEATDKEMFLFMGICKSFGLNPMKREVHLIKYGSSPAQIVTGYEVYLKRAERTGKVNGWSVSMSDDGKSATVTIHRKDWAQPFVWTAYRAEFDKGQANWKTMPLFMLRKVAMAQAFRICFPDEMGGLPYLPEEISNTGSSETLPGQIVDAVVEPVEDPKQEAPAAQAATVSSAVPPSSGESGATPAPPSSVDGMSDDQLRHTLNDMTQTAMDTEAYPSEGDALFAWTLYTGKDGKPHGYRDLTKLKGWQMKSAVKKAVAEGYVLPRQPGEDADVAW